MHFTTDFLRTTWAEITHEYHPTTIEFLGTLCVQVTAFWIPSSIFTVLDLLSPPQLTSYKIQQLHKQPPPNAIRKAFFNSLQTQTLSTIVHIAQLSLLLMFTPHTSVYKITPALPSPSEILLHVALCVLLREIIFYYGHRALHHPLLYRYIHKTHHEFTTPIALAAQYCHPIEHVICNIAPLSLPARVIGVHIVTFWLFIAGSLIQAVIAHCGYRAPALFGWKPEVHDLHHELFTVNYGIIGLWDRIHGTRATERRRTMNRKQKESSE
ncbi:putative C-4 methylsterol oxidase [Aspergillus karnatakaensis]|uniref:sterol desaturase family protein n=1 Tax=Aspergillus karnatakaensis TaxID=1810916 RepID=UPI003CCCDB66